LHELRDYTQGQYNISTVPAGQPAFDFLNTGLSMMGLRMLSTSLYEDALMIPSHILEMDCKGDLHRVEEYFSGVLSPAKCGGKGPLGYYVLRGAEIKANSRYLSLSPAYFFLFGP
jgi:hypothetical protein